MKRLFRKLFPKRTESMDVFVDFVLRNGCQKVEVAATDGAVSLPGPAGASMFVFSATEDIGTVYSVCCSAVAQHGEKMVYDHMRVVRYVSRHEYAADHERCALDVFFAAEKCAATLDQRLATVNVELLGASGIPVTGATREELHRRRDKYRATPPWGYP